MWCDMDLTMNRGILRLSIGGRHKYGDMWTALLHNTSEERLSVPITPWLKTEFVSQCQEL